MGAAVVDTTITGPLRHLHCWHCGRQVSTGFVAVPTETPDRGLIVRAVITCPECIEARTPIGAGGGGA